MRSLALAGFLLVTLFAFPHAFAFDVPPKPSGYVNDYANILKPETRLYLEAALKAFDASTTDEVVVVTVPALGDRDTIETLSIRFAETWKIGKEKKDNGIIFLVARDDREARIEVGYGLEGILPDSVAARILSQDVFPQFKAGDYDAGVIAGTNRIMGVVEGEPFAPEKKSFSSSISGNTLEIFAFFVFWIVSVLAQFLARSKSWWQGGLIGAFFGALFGYLFFSGIVIAVFAGVLGALGLLIDFLLSRHGPFTGGGRGGFGPSVWGGGFGGGRAGGGFSGGGGGFGGGGSSGKW